MSSRDDQESDSGTEEWAFETGEGIYSSPMVVDDTVYVGSDDCNLYAVDAATGTKRWSFETGGRVASSPTVVDGTVYVGSGDHNLYAVDVTTGTKQWSFETSEYVGSSPAVVDETVYIGSNDHNLYAVDAATGTEEWAFETEGGIHSSPTVVDGTVYVGSFDCNLYAVDAATGTKQWSFETGEGIYSSPTVVDDTVYVGSDDCNLYAVDAVTGSEEWLFEIGAYVASSPVVVDKTVYVGSYDYNLYAVDAATGTKQWCFETHGVKSLPTVISAVANRLPINLENGYGIESSPTVVDGTVYFGSHDDNLYAVNTATGTEEWLYETEGGIASSPTVVDGTVYVGSYDSNLYAITPPTRSGHRGTQPSESVSELTHASNSEVSFQSYLGGIEASKEKIPNLQDVRSPERGDFSPADFQTIETLGGGGQAVINKVRLPDNKTPPEVVAVREPQAVGTLTGEALEKFFESAETWATIDARERNKHRWDGYEHIVGVIATGHNHPWIAIEYMDGGDLTELLGKHPGGLPVGQALWIGECVCKGLEIAHQLGRVHLDVKPGNVLLKQTDGWPWPKLADWGLARNLAKESGTIDGLSEEYAAPEQFDSNRFGDPDQLTDIYQTGALVYALLTGEPPATGARYEIMQQVMSEDSIEPPSEQRSELSPDCDGALGLALERQKLDRYGSITDFRKALNAIRTGKRLPREVARRIEE